jgi:hypothetical protein
MSWRRDKPETPAPVEAMRTRREELEQTEEERVLAKERVEQDRFNEAFKIVVAKLGLDVNEITPAGRADSAGWFTAAVRVPVDGEEINLRATGKSATTYEWPTNGVVTFSFGVRDLPTSFLRNRYDLGVGSATVSFRDGQLSDNVQFNQGEADFLRSLEGALTDARASLKPAVMIVDAAELDHSL